MRGSRDPENEGRPAAPLSRVKSSNAPADAVRYRIRRPAITRPDGQSNAEEVPSSTMPPAGDL